MRSDPTSTVVYTGRWRPELADDRDVVLLDDWGALPRDLAGALADAPCLLIPLDEAHELSRGEGALAE